MKLIDRFLSRELLVSVAFAIAVLSLVLVVGNIFRKLLPLLVNHDVPMEYLITFIAYVLPPVTDFHHPLGTVNRDPARVWAALGGQRIDCPALKRRQHYAHLHPAGCDRARVHGDLLLA